MINFVPEIVAGERDVLPGPRRDLREKDIGNNGVLFVHGADGTAEIDAIPQDDGVDDQVEAGGAIGPGFGDTVPEFSKLMEEHGTRERMTTFSLVDGVRTPAQLGIEQLVADEDWALDPSNLVQRPGQPFWRSAAAIFLRITEGGT